MNFNEYARHVSIGLHYIACKWIGNAKGAYTEHKHFETVERSSK